MQSLLVILEVLGLLLATLDLIGVSPKIQVLIDKYRYKYFKWLYLRGNEKVATKTLFVVCYSVPVWSLFAWFWYALLTKSPDAGQVFVWWAAVALGPLVLLFLLLPLVYNALLLINSSKSKTVGTIAFVAAVLSSVLQRVWLHAHPCP